MRSAVDEPAATVNVLALSVPGALALSTSLVSLLKAASAPVSSVRWMCRLNSVFCTTRGPGLPQVWLGWHGGAMSDDTEAWICVGAGSGDAARAFTVEASAATRSVIAAMLNVFRACQRRSVNIA